MNIRYLWVLMVMISVILFLFQVSIDSLNPNATTLYNSNGSLLSSYNTGNYNQQIDINGNIPEIPSEVTSGSESGFADIFKFVKIWFQDSKSGKIIGGLYYSVPNILKGIGLPNAFSFALSMLWTLLSIFSFIMFMRGVQ